MAFRALLSLLCLFANSVVTTPVQRGAPDLVPRALPTNYPLSILCVGDSITVGVGDGYTTGIGANNGYRLDLYNLLIRANAKLEFVGTQSSGNGNPQPRMEGYGGWRILGVTDAIKNNGILRQQPNLILIHIGTNDMNIDTAEEPVAGAPARLSSMIEYVLCSDPNAVVLVAMIIQNNFQTRQVQTDAYNAQIPRIVGEWYKKGYKIRAVDMSMIGGKELSDILHPTPAGYQDMANRWYDAIGNIPDSWWTQAQAQGPAFGGPQETCARDAVSFVPAIGGNLVAAGAHVDSDVGEPLSSSQSSGNTFTPGWQDVGVVAIGTGYPGSGVQFADLDGDGLPDYIWVNHTDGSIRGWINTPPLSWSALNNRDLIAFGLPGASFVEFADLNNDRRAEYIVVANGHFRIFRNDGVRDNIVLWGELVAAGQQLDNLFGGYAGFHYFADMNGDGYADLIAHNANGVLDIYFNQGPSGDGFGWTPCLTKGIATGRLWFVDIDGDGRADYMSMDEDGGVSGWLNKPGGSCDITWVPINGRGPKTVALGAASAGKVRLVDMTRDGKADYLIVDDAAGTVRQFTNIGANHAPEVAKFGGYAAGVRLADLDGDGRDDYLSITDYTGVLAYLNRGQTSDSGWNWELQENGLVVALGYAGAKRYMIQFADVNGDGRDDYIVVDETTGLVHCYLNLGPSATSNWRWNITVGVIAIAVEGVRWADYDGDGRADYIVMDEHGALKVWLNQGPGDTFNWKEVNNGKVAALGVGASRADVRLTDIDGDGKCDYVWVHPDTGVVDIWYNIYDAGVPGWLRSNHSIESHGYPGRNINFGRIGTTGRGDYVAFDEATGAFRAWINQCSNVLSTNTRKIAGACAAAPMPPQLTTEPGPVPRPTTVSVDGGGHTVIQGTDSIQFTLPTGVHTPILLTQPNGVVLTYTPVAATEPVTTTDWKGQTVIQNTDGGTITLPTGIQTPVTTTDERGRTVTFNPPQPVTTTDSKGQTVIQNTDGGVITLPTGIQTPVTTTDERGKTVTFILPQPTGTLTTTDSEGHTVIQGSNGFITTLPKPTTVTTTDSNGLLTTIAPPRFTGVITTTDQVGQTVLSGSDGRVTLPFGITQVTTTTDSNGVRFTYIPTTTSSSTTSSSLPLGVLFPQVFTVEEPTSDHDDSIIPCKAWFFTICISWIDLRIGGWLINFPTGIRPPGPPPPIHWPPIPHLTISIKGGTLPPWPQISVDPKHTPHYDQNPPKDCKTQTGEIAMTTTTFGVSGTVTTASATLSTTLTVYGCEVTNTAITTAQTTSCQSTTTSSACIVTCIVTVTMAALSPLPTNCQTSTCTSTTSGCNLASMTGSTTSSVVYVCPISSPSQVATLTALPTLTSVPVYCTQTLCGGKEVLVEKTGPTCNSYTATCSSTSAAVPSPTINTNQGIVSCGTRQDAGNRAYWYSGAEFDDGKIAFCYNMTHNDPPIVFKPGTSVFRTGLYYAPDNIQNPIRFSAKWTVDDPGCPTTDMSADNGLCQDRVNTIFNACDTNLGGYYHQQGGKFFRDCITWEFTSNNNPVDL